MIPSQLKDFDMTDVIVQYNYDMKQHTRVVRNVEIVNDVFNLFEQNYPEYRIYRIMEMDTTIWYGQPTPSDPRIEYIGA